MLARPTRLSRLPPVAVLGLGLGVVLASVACSAPEPEAEAATDPTVVQALARADRAELDGLIADEVDLSGVELWIGSPDGVEGDATDALLAEITMAALDAAGAEVVDRTELGPGFLVRDSLLSGEIDLAWEGIGDAWTVILRQPADGLTADQIATRLRTRDLDENGVVWLPTAGFIDGPRFAVSEDEAEAGVTKLSDLGAAVEDDESGVICVTSAFVTFPTDGRVAVEEALDVTLPDEQLRVYDAEPIYPETGEESCRFGLVDASSGRIPEYGLAVLEDDVGAFLPNPSAPAVREDVVRDHPEVASLLAGLAARLTDDVIRDLNREVVIEGVSPEEAARRWLVDEGLLEAGDAGS